jgi:hypothetical protein|tara:strand:+ start:172 stop:477 length:306 start_codon:yes stop_codon:yes gene_type:complete
MKQKQKEFKFKQVDQTFDLRKLPTHDQEYLRTLVFETIGNRSYKQSGKPFHKYYPNANNFTLFRDHSTLLNYMSEFSGEYDYTTSHLLDGKKYYFAWTYTK